MEKINFIDVDKSSLGDSSKKLKFRDGTCWKAVCANMLSSAGYNPRLHYPNKLVDLANNGSHYDIYHLLITKYNPKYPYNPGWVENGLAWYLREFPEKANLYKTIEHVAYGSERNHQKIPLDDINLKQKLKQELEKGNKVSISISWVSQPKRETEYHTPVGVGGHALTLWDINEKSLVVTNSDRDPNNRNTEYERYYFDDYMKPNPNKYNLGYGHYFDYNKSSHPFIKYCVILKKDHDVRECNCFDKPNSGFWGKIRFNFNKLRGICFD